jgi:hypothetical protein
MKKFIFAALVAIFVAGIASAQVKVTGEGKRPGESPNRIVIDMGSSTPITTMSANRLSTALNELQAAILSLDEIDAYKEALTSSSCPLPNATMPTQVTLTLSEEDTTLTQNANGTATAYGVLCKKTNSCGSRDYQKVFQVNGTLTATLRGVSEDNLVRNLGTLVTLARSVRDYRVALVQSIAACRKPADNNVQTNLNPTPTPTPTPNQQVVSNNQPNEKEQEEEKKKGCGWETFWGGLLGAGGGGFGASRVGNNNRTSAGLVGGGTGAFGGALTARALCKSGKGSVTSVLLGGGVGAGGGTLTGFFFRGGNVRIPPGGGNTTGPIRVCNGLPCNLSNGGGNTGGNWNPIRINGVGGSTNSTPVTIRTTTTTTSGGSWNPVRIQ